MIEEAQVKVKKFSYSQGKQSLSISVQVDNDYASSINNFIKMCDEASAELKTELSKFTIPTDVKEE